MQNLAKYAPAIERGYILTLPTILNRRHIDDLAYWVIADMLLKIEIDFLNYFILIPLLDRHFC